MLALCIEVVMATEDYFGERICALHLGYLNKSRKAEVKQLFLIYSRLDCQAIEKLFLKHSSFREWLRRDERQSDGDITKENPAVGETEKDIK